MTAPRPVMFRAGGNPGEQPLPLKASVMDQAPAAAAAPQVLMADISEFQPEVTDRLYAAWSKAIIIRAAYGSQHDDRAWYGGQRRDQLHQYGIRFIGIYQYIVAGQDPARQAAALVNLVGSLRPGEKIIADIEEGSGNLADTWRIWSAEVAGALGGVPWRYSGLNFAAAHGLAPVDWVAAYQSTEPSAAHKLWQFTDAFQVPGVGTCDCSVYRGTIDQLAALAYQPALPRPQAAQEDDMIVLDTMTVAGPAVVLPVPSGAKTLTLYADDGYRGEGAPQVRVVFAGTGHGTANVAPKWAAPAALPVPAGSGSVSLARLGGVATPVTAAWS